tara:strand:+ start:2061 stop:2606 length:546 start_codon:yes stop_codon:yes gene_type:complete
MKEEKQILNEESIRIIIERLCYQLIENHNNFENTVIVGIQPRGRYLSNRILRQLNIINPLNIIESGNVDISFYRDDLMRRENPIVPEEMDMNLSVEGKRVVLIDDVLYTGRSVRSALDALMTFGRPINVELLILIDRRYSRHLPIQSNYVGRTVNAIDSEKVIVEWKELIGQDRVLIRKEQ